MFNGVDFNYLYQESLVTQVVTATANGPSVVNPTCSGSFTLTTVSKHCLTTGADSVDVTVTYSLPAASTAVTTGSGKVTGSIRADIQITNNSATDTVTQAMLSTLGVSMSQYNTSASHPTNLDSRNVAGSVNFQSGQFAIWNNAPSTDTSMNMSCGWSYVCKNQPIISNIAPGQTKTASFTLRFTNDVSVSLPSLAPEAYLAFATSYPSVVSWPDRRPIMAWFVADTSHQSATNPRGYLFDPTLDVSNVPAFTSRITSQAQAILANIQSRPIQPQGILIWDLEGEEFIQPTTYIGDPRVLGQGYSPEMDASADAIFATFKNAGLKVGMTLRPQQMQWGTTQPSTCNFDPDNNYKDYFIQVNAPFQQKFYGCYGTNNWALIPRGNGSQTSYTSSQIAQVTALLMSKVSYAHSRWGAQIYYVDSTVWVGGQPLPQDIFRALQLAFPDCLFIPEENYLATMGVAMPYSEPMVTADPKFAPVSWRTAYPTGGLGIYLSNCAGNTTCWNANLASFDIGQKVGDIPIITAGMMVNQGWLNIEAMITKARTEAGAITVTDSSAGKQYAYKGTPATIYQYPLKMRVYFADTPANIPNSTTYCEAGGVMGTTACTLNLNGLVTAQIRYYDFNNQLVITGTAGPR
jgi:hypothetical protein